VADADSAGVLGRPDLPAVASAALRIEHHEPVVPRDGAERTGQRRVFELDYHVQCLARPELEYSLPRLAVVYNIRPLRSPDFGEGIQA
jgi:hypothetical protein